MTSAYRSERRSFGYIAPFLGKIALPLVLALLGVSCGEVYRPVAIPIPGQSPTPAPVGHINVISTNGASPANPLLGNGSVSRIDVSGDSVILSTPAGLAPVHAVLSSGNGRLYVPNMDEDTVFASPTAAAPQGTTVDLVPVCDATGTICPRVNPVFAASTEGTRMYVAGMGNGTISVIDTNSNTVVHTFAVDSSQPQPDTTSQPVALAELPSGTKIYSVNKGTNSVSSINTLDGNIDRVIPVGPAPVWAAANADNLHVYVLDSSGTISVIDTTTDTVTSQASAGSPGGNPPYLVYDKVFNRVYATEANSAQPKLSLFDVSGTSGNPNSTLVPHGPGTAPITAVPGLGCSSNPIPTSVAILGDGSRAYVASYQTGNSLICTQVTVVDTASGLVTKTIPISVAPDNPAQTNCDLARFRVFAASSIGGTNSLFKVYVSQCDAGTVAVIDTAAASTGPNPHPADWLAGWLPSPVSSFPSSQVNISAATPTAPTATTPAFTTFAYSLVNGPAPDLGATIYVSGMADGYNNGAFVVTGTAAGTFTVANPTCGSAGATATTCVSATGQNGAGSVVPPQNPVFLVPAP